METLLDEGGCQGRTSVTYLMAKANDLAKRNTQPYLNRITEART